MTSKDVLAICDHLIAKGAVALEVSMGDVSVKCNLAGPYVAPDPFLVEQGEDDSIEAAQQRLEAALYYSSRSERK